MLKAGLLGARDVSRYLDLPHHHPDSPGRGANQTFVVAPRPGSSVARARECESSGCVRVAQRREVSYGEVGKTILEKGIETVKSAMRRRKRGTLRSGSGKKVGSRKQAITIGLSEAERRVRRCRRGGRRPLAPATRTEPNARLPRRSSRHDACFKIGVPARAEMEDDMNEDTLKGQWTQLKGRIREQWGKLTDDDLDQIQGRSEQLVGRIQERYGIARDDAKRQVDAWMRDVPVESTPPR